MKKTINKTAFVSKPIAAAVGLAMGALVAANTASAAVELSSNGLGDALMFPYYTVNNGYDTNINITNTSNKTVAFKIRFRESENSRDARDFNVVLSPYDVWNGSVTKNEAGGARLVTRDTSCTVGEMALLNPSDSTSTARYIDFTDFDYTDQTVEYGIDNADTGSTSIARTSEGHIEVIAMGATLNETNALSVAAKHSDGVPANCDTVRAYFTGGESDNWAQIEETRDLFGPAGNVLKGSVAFVNPNEGKAITSEPTVLANFFEGTASDNLVVLPGSQAPGLHDSTSGLLAVNELIARKAIANQYSVNPNANAKTDWVVTFPTKHYHVDERNPFSSDFTNVNDGAYYTAASNFGLANLAVLTASADAWPVKPGTSTEDGVAMPPFAQTFQSGTEACAPVRIADINLFDREEDEYTPPSEVGFSPAKPAESQSLCKEVQVITFNNSNLFGASGAENIDLTAAGFVNGWMGIEFNVPTPTTAQSSRFDADVITTAEAGFPVIGFSATTLERGNFGEYLMNYGFSSNHAYPESN